MPDSESITNSIRLNTPTGSKNSDGQGGSNPRAIRPKTRQFDRLLESRNVNLEPEKSGAGRDLEQRIAATNVYNTTDEQEEDWARDLEKCKTAYEAVFQHTIIIEVIDRQRLRNQLDYMCELNWLSPELPIIPPLILKPPPIKKPRPDLSVAFKLSEIIDRDRKLALKELHAHMCPEENTVIQVGRAFPFFIIEVKGARADVGDIVATRQCLHTASLALYNIWKFFEDEKTEHEFFEKVRIFSATGHGEHFRIRVHWATKAPRGNNREIKPICPLFFRYQNLKTWAGGEYRRDKVIGMIRNILDYEIDELLPLLKQAVQTKLAKNNPEARQQAMAQPPTVQPELPRASSSIRKRTSPSSDALGRSDASTNKRQAIDGTGSFASTTSASRWLDDTHLYESDRSLAEVAG